MTSSYPSFKLLLTTALCGFLAACGGDKGTPSGGYTGESTGERTAGYAGAAHATPIVARLNKLEQDVALLKNDMSQLAVGYNGLVTTNERIDSLITHMEDAKRAAPTPAVEKADLMPVVQSQPAPVKKEEKKTAVLPKEPTVLGVRLGEHPGKTRLVIDWSKLGDVQTDLDNAEKLLIVTLSNTQWTAKETVANLSSPLVSGWSVQDNGGAKTLVIQLKKSAKIAGTSKLKAEGGKPARVVIDLTAA